ncbi:MAG: hypothetical protein ACM3NQ_12180 [Bacteroidales bacterium]
MIRRPRDPVHAAAAAATLAIVLTMPWPVGPIGNGQTVAGALVATSRELHVTAYRALKHRQDFRANLDTPRSGEQVLPGRVQEVLSILEGEGRGVKRYAVSGGLSADLWDRQQLVVATWPRKLEPNANARFQLQSEPMPAGCSLVDKRKDVLLAYCP